MKTSQKQISKNGEVKSMFSQEDFLANHSVLQERERERKITAISGAKCYEQYGKFSQLGSLVKTLLVSSQWFSPARRLKWDVQTICSKRISYTEQSSNSRLPPSVKTLNVQDIQSKRLLFRLVPSERHTDATECGLLQGLIPTPLASDARGGAAKLVRGKRLRNGQVFSATLKDLAESKILPTPQTQGLKVCNKDGKTEFLNLGLLLTPSASDGLRAGMSMESLKSHKKKNAEQSNLAEQIAHKVGGGTSQLNPLFVAEMMGYPLDWLTLPFLSQSGEAKASRR